MPNGPDHIIACDGGGSLCRIAIADVDGRVLASAEGQSANPATSMETAISSLQVTLHKARQSAGLNEIQIAKANAWFGLAGVISAGIATAIAEALPIDNVTVSDDRPTNMAGALGGTDGYVAAIGTGSFLGRQSGSEQRFIGGWGLRLGDEASGAWLGRRLLSRVLDWRDGVVDGTDLLAETFGQFDNRSDRIVLFANTAKPADFARFAPDVVQAANSGDPAGLSIMRDGARYIERSASALGFTEGAPLCLLGGVGPSYRPFLDDQFTGNITKAKGNALDGAIQLARSMKA